MTCNYFTYFLKKTLTSRTHKRKLALQLVIRKLKEIKRQRKKKLKIEVGVRLPPVPRFHLSISKVQTFLPLSLSLLRRPRQHAWPTNLPSPRDPAASIARRARIPPPAGRSRQDPAAGAAAATRRRRRHAAAGRDDGGPH